MAMLPLWRSTFLGLSTTNNTYETVNHDGVYIATADDTGKKLFLVFAGQAGEGGGHKRICSVR